jgi:hypothetical protein
VPTNIARFGQVGAVLELGQAEVRHPDVAEGVEQEVRRLDVAVQDVAGVGIGQGVGDLGAEPGDLAEVPGLGRPDERAGRRSGSGSGGIFGGRGRSVRPGRGRLGQQGAGRGRAGFVPGWPRVVPAGDEADGDGSDQGVDLGRGRLGGILGGSEASDVVQDPVESLAGDELHDVVADAALRPVVEHRHDVRVVQPGGGAGLVAEAEQVFGIGAIARVQDLQGHVRAEVLAHRLVDDAHAALADPAQDAVIAQPVQRRVGHGRGGGGGEGACADGRARLGPLHLDQEREQLVDVVGVLGVPFDIFGQARVLAPAEAGEERLGQPLDRIPRGVVVAHGRNSSIPPGIPARISFSRLRARM